MSPRFLTFKSSLLTLALIALPVFVYLFSTSTPETLSLLTKDYQETGTQVKQDFQSLPALPLTEEKESFTLTDTVSDGIDIKFANQAETPPEKKGLSLSFPKDYSKPMEVKLDDTRTIQITDLSGKNDYTTSTLSSDQVASEQNTSFFQKLFGKKKALSQNYLRYTSKDERKSLLYAYQKDQATGEKKLKHWTFYQEGNGVEQESYKIENSKVKINQEGIAEVFYYGEQSLKNDQAAAEVDSNLMERAQRTLAKEMGEDLLSGNYAPDFTIPKPYYVDKGGEKHEAEWKWNEESKTLSLSFSPESYPVALDPTLTFTAPGQSNGGSVIGGEAGGSGYNFATVMVAGDFNTDGKMDLAVSAPIYGPTYDGRVYIFYNDGAFSSNAVGADVIIRDNIGYVRFGNGMAAGDVNADGRTDLLVATDLYDTSQAGAVKIFYNDGSYPTTSSTADITIIGEASSNFGSSIVTGDFNADSKTDLAVGAPRYSTSTGRAYIFYNDGSIPTTAATADVTITGNASGDLFGAILTAGDLDADGKIDLVVGAGNYSSNTGRAYIFYNDGSIPTTAATADVTITGNAGSDYFGGHSMVAGDFNADGRVDLAISAVGYSAGSFAGRVYIFYNDGSIPTTAATADVTITGTLGQEEFAYTLRAGDMNADGRTDLVATEGNYYNVTGRAYIFYNDGSLPTTTTAADVIITGDGGYFGISSALGDFNADGKTDLAVGAYGYASNIGRAYIFYSQNGTVNTNQTFTGETTSNFFGSATAVGDFNADGRTDLAIGAYGYSSSAGRTYIFYGDGQLPTTAATADVIITGEASSTFGAALAAGDFNADGKTDLAVGAQGYSSSSGRAYIFYNDGSIPTTAATADVLINTEGFSSRFGTNMIAGDFNADSKTDIVIGALGYAGGNENGRAYLFTADGTNNFGTASCTGSSPTICAAGNADAFITGENNSDRLTSAFTAGDFNSDGKIDLAIGAYAYTTGTGRTYIFYNGSITTEAASGADVIITGAGTLNDFGLSLTAGDMNSDGRTDLVVGADGCGGSAGGCAYVFYNDGSYPTSASSADVTIAGTYGYLYFGATVATGDFNADGRTDLVVGARHYDSYVGRVFVYYNDGSYPSASDGADITIIGTAFSDEFGATLTAGDMNGDGRVDLIVGSPQYAPTNTGQVYIYETRENFAWQIQKQLGTGVPRTGLNTSGQELSIVGQATSNFGYALTSGDFNADGKVDLAVGANILTSSTGRVYIFYSNGALTTGAASADVVITGEASANQFGVALSSGDMNSDGKTDLLVGALGYSSTTGRVYAFYNDGVYPATATNADLFFTGEAGSDRFGESLRTGDLDASGTTDLVVGSRAWTSSTGRAYVFYNDGSMPTTAATADAIMTGETTSNSFGAGLTTGDFNADGKADLAVGAWGYSTSTGRTYIFYSGSITSENATGADVIITGGATSNLFGITLESGDFNADGKTDLAAAARDYSSLLGRVYLFYNDGSIPTTVGTADVTIGGESTSSYFGGAMKAADFNQDGRTDLAVGAVLTSSTTGKAFIFYNDGSWPATGASADVAFTGGEAASDAFGNSLAAGDFNADGKMDLAVGAYGYSSTAGKVYVYTFGNDPIITGETTSNYFGGALTTGDFNADGRTDLALSAVGYTSNTGRVYVFYNDGIIPTAAASADAIITGQNTGDYFGRSIAAGDMNADGKTDLVVGASEYSTATGRVYMFYSGAITTENASGADVILSGNGGISYGRFGFSLVTADLDSDGDTDLVTGTDSAGGYIDTAYLFKNDGSYPAGATTADTTFTGVSQTNFGSTLTTGDLNADGRVDLVVGANYTGGGAYIFYNDGSMPTTAATADVTITGEAGNVYFTNALVAGDFNADGKTDLGVGSYGYSSNSGRVYVFYNDGSIPTTAATADVIITGEATNSYFGVALASGDWNADGRTDLAIGAHQYSVENGRVYLFYNDGSYPSLSSDADMKMTGDTTFIDFGASLAAGDLNSDGKTDLLVGATTYSTNTGRVYIFTSEAAAATLPPGTMYLKGTGKLKGTSKIK